jgi:D-methionine transport system substrate-binding protein
MKKLILILLVLTLGMLAACGNKEEANTEEGLTKVKVGVSGGDTATWDYIVDIAKDQGLDIDLVTFNDYVQPNIALAEGELDANAFQTISYFDEFKTAQSLDLEAIGSTVIAPMAIHSKKHKTLEDLPDGATIALPNEGTNFGRALLLMQEAGLITLTDDFVGIGAMDKIKDNPKSLKIEAVAAGNTPRFLDDVDASIINNNFAIEASLELDNALFHESATAKPYINIIAVKTGDSDRPELQKLVEIYHSKEVEDFIIEKYKGSSIPTFVSLEELLNYKDSWK